jgi:hypothetical protein
MFRWPVNQALIDTAADVLGPGGGAGLVDDRVRRVRSGCSGSHGGAAINV